MIIDCFAPSRTKVTCFAVHDQGTVEVNLNMYTALSMVIEPVMTSLGHRHDHCSESIRERCFNSPPVFTKHEPLNQYEAEKCSQLECNNFRMLQVYMSEMDAYI